MHVSRAGALGALPPAGAMPWLCRSWTSHQPASRAQERLGGRQRAPTIGAAAWRVAYPPGWPPLAAGARRRPSGPDLATVRGHGPRPCAASGLRVVCLLSGQQEHGAAVHPVLAVPRGCNAAADSDNGARLAPCPGCAPLSGQATGCQRPEPVRLQPSVRRVEWVGQDEDRARQGPQPSVEVGVAWPAGAGSGSRSDRAAKTQVRQRD